MFENILADFKHYRAECGPKGKPLLLAILINFYAHPASTAVVLYRFGNWSWKLPIPILREFFKLLYVLVMPVIRLYSGVQIHPCTEIGKGLVILHFGGVVLCRDCKIGENCILHHNVSIVTTDCAKAAQIGNNFFAGTNTTIVNSLIIEDNVICGAGSVVSKSVPANAIIAGVPAKILRFRKVTEIPPKLVHGHHSPMPFLEWNQNNGDGIETVRDSR